MCTCCKWVTGKPLWRSLDLPDIYWMIGSLQALHGLRIWTSCDGKQKPLVCVHVVSLNIAGWNRRSWVRYDPRQTVTVWHSRSGHNTATDAVVYRQAKQNTLKKPNSPSGHSWQRQVETRFDMSDVLFLLSSLDHLWAPAVRLADLWLHPITWKSGNEASDQTLSRYEVWEDVG